MFKSLDTLSFPFLMLTLEEQKKALRKQVRELKKAIPAVEKELRSARLFEHLETLDVFREASTLMAYWAMEDEVQTREFILKWFTKKQIILPSVDGDQLRLKVFTGLSQMEAGESFGIPEPGGEDFLYPDTIRLVLVPGLAFDRDNHRMGRGKAFYDRLLPKLKAYKIGLAFSCQVFNSIPSGPDDIRMDLVLDC